jgi:hypothetical protein
MVFIDLVHFEMEVWVIPNERVAGVEGNLGNTRRNQRPT